MLGNLPITDLPDAEETWLMLAVTSVRRRTTQQGHPFYEARGCNATGCVSLRAWSETIHKSGALSPGLWRVTGFWRERLFVATEYEPVSLETYIQDHGYEPVLPRAFTLDIETIALPGFRSRAARKLEGRYRYGEMHYDQQQRYLADRGAEEERTYRGGALAATSGRVLCIAVQVAPQPEFSQYSAASALSERVFGIDHAGREEGEERALRDFLAFMRRFNQDIDEIVGHNVVGFDLPFIYQRCIALGMTVRPMLESTGISVFDTMRAWSLGDRRNASLDDIAWAMGIESSKTADAHGGKIHELYSQGRLFDIRDYNLRDVQVTRQVYDRMVAILGR